jgi:hypothetical protein
MKTNVLLLICALINPILVGNALAEKDLGSQFIIGCRDKCVADSQNVLDISFFSTLFNCNCYCDNLKQSISDEEQIHFRRDGVFIDSLKRKQAIAFNQCFSGAGVKPSNR